MRQYIALATLGNELNQELRFSILKRAIPLHTMSVQTRLLSEAIELASYDRWTASVRAPLWQSMAWKTFQETLGRNVRVYVAEREGATVASALVIVDRTLWNLCAWDIPRGPLWTDRDAALALLDVIRSDAVRDHCLSITYSPLEPLHVTDARPSGRHEQPEATRVLDLTATEDTLLAQMHPKGRYNIRVAEKHGVCVEVSSGVEAFHRLLRSTGERDQFGIRPLSHYKTFLDALPGSFLLLAFQGATDRQQPIAGLLGVIHGSEGIYYYGASSYAHRALMAPYALQWAAIRRCKAAGCTTYDLLGIAPSDAYKGHPWTGVSAFKEKFGGRVVTYPREQQIVLRPTMNAILKLKRRILG